MKAKHSQVCNCIIREHKNKEDKYCVLLGYLHIYPFLKFHQDEIKECDTKLFIFMLVKYVGLCQEVCRSWSA